MSDDKPLTTIAVLLYGDYPELAERCLKPLSRLHSQGVPLLVGANEISDKTRDVVNNLGLTITHDAKPQIYKYPMMRKLLASVETPYFMWFDDDSYIKDPDPATWLKIVECRMVSEEPDQMGSLYRIQLTASQMEWVRSRPWFKDKNISGRPLFATGGWWVAKTETLRELKWPDKALKHRGGDVMLGVALHQNGKVLKHFNQYVAINADTAGAESKSKRRGYDEKPIGVK